jgi:hypothetical protein
MFGRNDQCHKYKFTELVLRGQRNYIFLSFIEKNILLHAVECTLNRIHNEYKEERET